jgi:hypothetical protein
VRSVHDGFAALEAGFHLHLVKPVASASVIEVLNLMERSDAQAASHEDRLALSETAVVE